MENRSFKFRAWDKNKKEMITNFVFAPTFPDWSGFPIERVEWLEKYQQIIGEKLGTIDDDYKLKLLEFVTSDYSLIDWANWYGINNYIITQFTGFLDINEKEIYEHDIVKVKNATGKMIKGIIKFVDGCFDIEFLNPIKINNIYKKKDYLKCWIINYVVEIIGNIYQNGELLNENT